MKLLGSTNLRLRASAAILVTVGLALAVGWTATARTRTVLYTPPTPVTRLELDLGSGNADIVGGRTSAVRVQRIDRFAFGHAALEQRSLAGGVLRLASGCPRIILGSCSSSYRVTVPDDISVSVRTGAGHVHFDGFRGSAQIRSGSGDVSVDAFCGFGLSAITGSGSVTVVSACAPEALDVRTDGGDATVIVPPGRYRVAAATLTGRRRVRGVLAGDQAPFSIVVQSRSGDVTVAGGL